MEVEITAGFLVVKNFERMYRDYLTSLEKLRRVDFREPHAPYSLVTLMQFFRCNIFNLLELS